MRIINEPMTIEDIEKEINYSIANEINTHFIVNGLLASIIVAYLDTEHEIPVFTETEDGSDIIEAFEYDKVYTISLSVNDDYVYFCDEAYHDGIFLMIDDDDAIAYIQDETELTTIDLKRIITKDTLVFNIDEDNLFDLTEDENCDIADDCKHCPCGCYDQDDDNEEEADYKTEEKSKVTSVEYSNVNGKKTYKVNGKVVNKDTYDKTNDKMFFADVFELNDIFRLPSMFAPLNRYWIK